MKTLWFQGKALPVIGGILVTLATLWLQFSDSPLLESIRQRMESLAYDFRLNATLAPGRNRPQDIVIVDIDEQSLAREGRWPWPRDKVALLTDRLFAAGAVVVGFDIVFSEEQENSAAVILDAVNSFADTSPSAREAISALVPRFDHDVRLAQSLHDRDVVLGYLFHNNAPHPVGMLPRPIAALSSDILSRLLVTKMESYTANLPLLQRAAGSAGFTATHLDPDGILRRSPLILRHGEALYASLALEMARLYYLLDDIGIETASLGGLTSVESITLGDIRIPTDHAGRVIIPYQGPAKSFPYYSATQVLEGTLKPGVLDNKLVLIGTSALGLSDLRSTPVQSAFPGVEVHANLLAGILANVFPAEPSWTAGVNVVTTLVVGLLLALLLPYVGPLTLLLITLAAMVTLVGSNLWFWHSQRLVLAISVPLLMVAVIATMNMAYGFFVEARRRDQLKNMFGQYVPPALVEEMSRQSDRYGFDGESRELTVLFADIRQFTTLSERLGPTELKQLLNLFFTHMTRIIFEKSGTIDKYVGDMIMAFWGAPVADPHHASHAIDAALAMLQKVEALKSEFRSVGLPEIEIGIGLNSGEMNVGDMGSEFRRAYTVLGDAVNLGSRIEGLTKFYGAKLLVGETTRQGQDDFVFRRLDRVRVKGKREAVTVFEPLCRSHEASESLLKELARHEQALDCYLGRDWDAAEHRFMELNAEQPQARIYQLYLERIASLKAQTLSEEWDGIYAATSK